MGGAARRSRSTFPKRGGRQNFSEAGNAQAEEGERERSNAGNSEAGCCFPE